jgi:hypothetical protein
VTEQHQNNSNFITYYQLLFLCIVASLSGSQDSAVSIATGYGLEGRGITEFESRWEQDFSPLHAVQTGSGAHPASYPMDTGDSYPGGKAAGA